MSSLLEALSGAFGGGQDILFLTEVLKQYREIRKVYAYDYSEEDKAALKACATDLRPFTYSFLPGGATYYALSRMVKNPKQLGGVTRAVLVLLRLAAAAEVFRVGYLAGSYVQGMDCTRRLVELRSPLGGEIVAIIRSRDPQHPLLKHERQPAELLEDGSRPRIVSEANRLAQIARFQRELAAAKAGQAGAPEDAYNRSADEYLFRIMQHREEDIGRLQAEGGSAAAVASGRLEAARPQPPRSWRAEYEAAGAAGAASAGGVSAAAGGAGFTRGGGLVIRDEPVVAQGAALQQHAADLAATITGPQRGGGSAAGSGGVAPAADEDALSMVLGGGLWGEEPSEEARQAAEREAERQRRRAERRKRWWRRHGSAGADQ